MRALFAIALMALSAGCASSGMPATDRSGPLRAYLLPHSNPESGLSFHVSRSAHVAVFRITPGRGTALVYPWVGYEAGSRRLFSGFHNIGVSVGRDRDFMPSYSYPSSYGPEFYFLIASEEPLRLDQMGGFGSGLSTAMGASYAFSSSFGAMERLVELAVPNVADDSWTTDYYVHWPELPNQNGVLRQRTLVQINCNGVVYNVPVELAAWAATELCPQTQGQPSSPTDGAPRDSVVEPTRRAPVDVADRISSAQLSDPEVWEELRGYAETAAVTRDLRSRAALDSDDFGDSGFGNESVNRSRPTTRAGNSSTGSGNAGSGNPDTPRSRPAPESVSRPNPPAERERPEPSSDGSAARPLAPPQPE